MAAENAETMSAQNGFWNNFLEYVEFAVFRMVKKFWKQGGKVVLPIGLMVQRDKG